MSKLNAIRQWLLSGKSITQKEAIEVNCYRLGARILDLRAAGMNFRTTAVPKGDGSTFAKYWLEA